jgi:uncharacterized membrane protein
MFDISYLASSVFLEQRFAEFSRARPTGFKRLMMIMMMVVVVVVVVVVFYGQEYHCRDFLHQSRFFSEVSVSQLTEVLKV